MKRKSVRILLLSIGTVLVLGLCVFKFAEEIVTIKGKVYPPVVAFVKDLLSADPDVSEYSPVVHSGNEWYFSVPLIYHAAGGIDGLVYSNSKEALEHTLSQGNTFVEIDFMYTSDGHLVCVHDWDTLVGGGGHSVQRSRNSSL